MITRGPQKKRPLVLAAERNRKRIRALYWTFAIQLVFAFFVLVPNTGAVLELGSMSRDDSALGDRPCDEFSVLITVTRTEILVDGLRVAPVEPNERFDGRLINEPLFESLTARQGSRACANIRSDKQVAFKTIKQVMFTTASAGYRDISFATMSALPE